MSSIRSVLVAGLFLLIPLILPGTGARAAEAPLTGTWNLSIESPQGKRTPTLMLVQSGADLTGSYKSQMGEAPVTGQVTGNEFSFNVKMSRQGQEIVIAYHGTVSGDEMRGTLSMGRMGEIAFTGKRAGN